MFPTSHTICSLRDWEGLFLAGVFVYLPSSIQLFFPAFELKIRPTFLLNVLSPLFSLLLAVFVVDLFSCFPSMSTIKKEAYTTLCKECFYSFPLNVYK